MEETKGGIMRGFIDGKEKYCRVGIRRRRASVEDAVQFFRDSIRDTDELLAGDEDYPLNVEDKRQMRFAQRCMFTALDALKKMEEA